MLLLAALWGCVEKPEDGTGAVSLLDCDTAGIEDQAAKNQFQLSFAACGSNSFSDFAWSTDGHKLYYQLGMTQHVLLADRPDKKTIPVPAPTAIGPAAWPTASRVVMPVGPNPEVEEGPLRLATFDLETNAVTYVDLPKDLRDPADLNRTRKVDSVYLTAVRGEAARASYEVSLVDGAIEPAFDWLGPVDTFTFTPAADAVMVGRGQTVTLYDATSREAKGAWTPAIRGTIHPKALWVVLEHEGAPYQLMAPDGETPVGDPMKPPLLSFAEVQTGGRWLLKDVQGSKFEWYEITDLYGSFVLWGFDGRPYRRNIMLGDLLERMTGAEMGVLKPGIVPMTEADGATYTR
jgi:hypothetical protein